MMCVSGWRPQHMPQAAALAGEPCQTTDSIECRRGFLLCPCNGII